MKRRICSLLLILCLLTQFWPLAFAASSMTTSPDGKAFIKEHQGNTSYNLTKAEKEVNAFLTKYNLKLPQHQFDALTDFVVAYPNRNILSSGYKIEKVIASQNYTDAQLASAFTAWVKGSDGNVSSANLARRVRESMLFLYDNYEGDGPSNFRYVLYHPNGGSLKGDYNSVTCYTYYQPYGDLAIAGKSNQYFAGWYTEDGEHILNSTKVTKNLVLYARWSTTSVSNPNGESTDSGNSGDTGDSGNNGGNTGNNGGNSNNPLAPGMKVSVKLIEFLKQHEGFRAKAYWDNHQYTIGYGTKWNQDKYPSGVITEAQAEEELKIELKKFQSQVDALFAKSSISHTQSQYDALVSFTFNLGGQWMSSENRIYNYVLRGYPSELELVDSFGVWSKSGGSIVPDLMRRRLDEADMYLNGNYDRFGTTYFGAKLLPNGSGATVNGSAYELYFCRAGDPIGNLPTPVRSGYTFHHWYDAATGNVFGADTIAPTLSPNGGVVTLYAKWTEGESTLPEQPPKPTTPDSDPEPDPEPDPDVPTFTDLVEGAWYVAYVNAAVERGLLKGLGNGRFGPESPMTRAMVVTVLHRMVGTPKPTVSQPFTDVESGQWYTDAIAWAYEAGVAKGISATHFGKDDYITREQLVTMLYRFAILTGVSSSGRNPLTDFKDTEDISDYAREAFEWAVAMDIIAGSKGMLTPTKTATRAQCAKIMVLFSDFLTY